MFEPIIKLIRHCLPNRLRRLIRRPVLLPGYYKSLAQEVEPVIDLVISKKDLDEEYWKAQLRKYAHIIDKGLQRPDFETGHSRQWYDLAVDALQKVNDTRDDPSVEWAKQRLKLYEARQSGLLLHEPLLPAANDKESFDILEKVIRSRRSLRCFAERKLEPETLKQICEVINWSPTSCNRQPAKVFATRNPELVRECLKNCSGATCFTGGIGSFAAFCADLRVYDFPEEMLTPDLDIGLGLQNCLLTAHALGVSISLLSWARHTPQEDTSMRALLGIPPHYRIVVNGLMGYPALVTEAPARKMTEQTLIEVE